MLMSSRLARLTPIVLSTALVLSLADRVVAVSLGMVDDFQAGTTAGWGGGAPAAIVPNVGPTGAGDNALSITATTGRVAIVNTAQWTGDYGAAGVTKILVDVRHQNTFPLQLRLGLASGAVGSGGAGDTYVSAVAVPAPNDGQWHRVALSLAPADFVPHTANSNPSPNAAAALANVSHLRILHNPVANFLGANGPATLFLDNIQTIPEPTALVLTACAIGALGLTRSMRGRPRNDK
jgi:hypothetical protein